MKKSGSWVAILWGVAIVASCESSDQPPAVEGDISDLKGPTLTLNGGSATQSGYDFHAKTYQGASGGDFYFTSGAFWANNAGQRGVKDVGTRCPALTLSAMPTSGYGSNLVTAVSGHCYVALTKGDTRDFVVFQVSTVSSGSVSLIWTLVKSGDSGVTLTNTTQGYEFSSKAYVDSSVSDFYFLSGSLWANNRDQHGVVALGACSSVESAPASPATGYNRNGVALSAGTCYAAIMRYDPRNRIVFRVDSVNTSSTTLTWHLVPVPINQLAWQHCDPYIPGTLANTGVPADILASWLQQHPSIADAMQWMQPVAGTPTTIGYTSWPADMQAMLTTNFVAYWNWYNSGMTGADPNPTSDPPINHATFPTTALSVTDAQSLYVKYVALTLVVEIQRRVPWTILAYDSASLAELLDARKFFTEYTSDGYVVITMTVVPAPPLVSAQFVAQNNFLCGNRPATIAEAVFWARNLKHFQSTSDPAVDFWQYLGAPPASRVLAGTNYTGTSDVPKDVLHWTLGCHGTTGLLKMLLRTLNVPVEHFSSQNPSVSLPQDAFVVSTHAVPHFLADGLWLSHGDDPYTIKESFPSTYAAQLPYPLQAMLLTDARFFTWFPNPGTCTVSCPTVGQQTDDLFVRYGDTQMLRRRLLDLQTTPPTDQNICSYVTVVPGYHVYTCAEAEQMGLLSMLDPLVQPYVGGGDTLEADISHVPDYYPLLPQTFGLLNPSFIDGLSGWTTTGTASMATSGCYGDTSCLVLGASTATNGDSTATQTFTAPPGSTGISLWFKETCPDTVTFDWATVTLTDLSANAVTTLLAKTCTTNGWTQVTGAITAGHNYTLTLTSHDDAFPTDPTITLFDNVVFTSPATPASGIVNGGFEAGLSGWTAAGASVGPVAGGYAGAMALQLGGMSPTSGDSSASQSFVVPAGTSNFSLRYKMTCPDTVTFDWVVVTLVDNTTGLSSTLVPKGCATIAWTQASAVLTAGHSYTLTLTSHDDAYPSDPSYTLFDAVSLN